MQEQPNLIEERAAAIAKAGLTEDQVHYTRKDGDTWTIVTRDARKFRVKPDHVVEHTPPAPIAAPPLIENNTAAMLLKRRHKKT